METSPTPPPAPERPKMNPLLRIVVVVCGLIAIVTGVMQMKKGIGEVKGAQGTADPQLLNEIEKAVNEGNKLHGEAAPLLQALVQSVDRDGLEAVRQKGDGQKVIDLFGQAQAQFRTAADQSAKASEQEKVDAKQQFLVEKAHSYDFIAQALGKNQEIARTVMDPALTKMDEVVAKVTTLGQERDELQKKMKEADAAASAKIKQ